MNKDAYTTPSAMSHNLTYRGVTFYIKQSVISWIIRAPCFCKAGYFKFEFNGTQEFLIGFEVLLETSYVEV